MGWVGMIKTVSFELNDLDYEADLDITYNSDQNYGADSDNNRGVVRETIEDYEIEEVREDGWVVDLTPEMVIEIQNKITDGDLDE